ncbi:putative signal peptide protein [Puccinia sorghi]|uniref:Putative signal peptide protein n=1 Tax=Puccinia sorghi TaxID=27349 RepID=A0A0L6VEK8_9BASI|nr:putative signal peptide protein [Puccinia sorghi]
MVRLVLVGVELWLALDGWGAGCGVIPQGGLMVCHWKCFGWEVPTGLLGWMDQEVGSLVFPVVADEVLGGLELALWTCELLEGTVLSRAVSVGGLKEGGGP